MLKKVMRSGMRVACFYMHVRRVGTENLDAEEHQNRALVDDPKLPTRLGHFEFKIERPRFVRESTYMCSSSGSRRRSASRYLPCASKIHY